MKNLKNEDLIKLLPFQDNTKTNLLNLLKNADKSTTYDIQKILWKYYFVLEDEFARIKYNQFLEEIKEGKRQISSELFEQARESVRKEFEDILNGKKEVDDQINQIRSKLQTLTKNPN